MPKRIQLRRAKGWRKPEKAVVVSRPNRWGNNAARSYPEVSRAEAAEAFEQWISERPTWQEAARRELRGRDLACWCPLDEPCHADILLKIANAPAAPVVSTEGAT